MPSRAEILGRDVSDAVLQQAARIRLLILDVDGVLTDGRLYYGSGGVETKAFHAQDGSAMQALIAAGVPIAIISGRSSEALDRRTAELGVRYVYAPASDKSAALDALSAESGMATADMAHAGDDLADLALFSRTGIAFAVPNAHPYVKARADYVTVAPGGEGAVREICDLILVARGKWTREPH